MCNYSFCLIFIGVACNKPLKIYEFTKKITQQYPSEDFLSEDFYCAEPSINQEEFNFYLQKALVLDSLVPDTIPAGVYKLVAVFEIKRDLRISNNPGYIVWEKGGRNDSKLQLQ